MVVDWPTLFVRMPLGIDLRATLIYMLPNFRDWLREPHCPRTLPDPISLGLVDN